MSKIYKLSDEVFNTACAHCGTTFDLQMWPHRNVEGKIVGFVFACSKCFSVIPGATVTIAYTREKETS